MGCSLFLGSSEGTKGPDMTEQVARTGHPPESLEHLCGSFRESAGHLLTFEVQPFEGV